MKAVGGTGGRRWTQSIRVAGLATVLGAGLGVSALVLPAWAQGLPQPGSRGQLLYGNHCVACHTTQMHWRDRKLVTDWASLKVQVRRWQEAAQLNWPEAYIDDVARFLNDTYYRLPSGRVALQALQR